MATVINKRVTEYKKYNAQSVLLAVEKYIRILEMKHNFHYKWSCRYKLKIRDCYDELSIFDWWHENLSISQLKQMRSFLKEAIKLGYTGYVCFKVGASGCANGMWADKVPTTDGYSPKGEFLYRSFSPDYTYWDICDYSNGYAKGEAFKLSEAVGKEYDELTTIKALEEAITKHKEVA